MSAVRTEPVGLHRRVSSNSRHRVPARSSGARCANSGTNGSREGCGGLTNPVAQVSAMAVATMDIAGVGRPGAIPTAAPGTRAEHMEVADGHGGHWKAPCTQHAEVRL